MITLAQYIDRHFNGHQSAFAKAQGVQRAQVTQWLKGEYFVSGNELLLKRRTLEKKAANG